MFTLWPVPQLEEPTVTKQCLC